MLEAVRVRVVGLTMDVREAMRIHAMGSKSDLLWRYRRIYLSWDTDRLRDRRARLRDWSVVVGESEPYWLACLFVVATLGAIASPSILVAKAGMDDVGSIVASVALWGTAYAVAYHHLTVTRWRRHDAELTCLRCLLRASNGTMR